jgi:hypothetical protein
LRGRVLAVECTVHLILRHQFAVKASKDSETRRLWKKFQQLLTLPEKDQRAVMRLVNSLVGAKGE